MTDAAIQQRLDRLLEPRIGYVLDPWPRVLMRLLEELAQRESCTVGALLDGLLVRPRSDIIVQLVSRATIGHTRFFRHADHFARLEGELATRGSARIWSLGCATGEEAYSLALTARRAAANVEILATDVDAVAIARARAGEFATHDATTLPEASGEGSGAGPSIQDSLKFEVESMDEGLSRRTDERFDYIFCRNVLIYHSRVRAGALLERLAHLLAPGGALVVAPTEALLPQPQSLQAVPPIGWLQRTQVAAPGLRSRAPKPVNAAASVVTPLRQAATTGTDTANATREDAARRLASGDFDAAEEGLRARLDGEPDDAVAWFLLGEVMLARAQTAQARVAFGQAESRAVHADGVDPETLARAARRRSDEAPGVGQLERDRRAKRGIENER